MSSMHGTAPPDHVLRRFGIAGDITPTRSPDAWRVGSASLKSVDHPAAVEWWCDLLSRRDRPKTFRVPQPLPADDGSWIVNGWSASEWLMGDEDASRWLEIIESSNALSSWLADEPRPDWLDQIWDPWRAADKAAWGEHDLQFESAPSAFLNELAAMRLPIPATNQLVHGDLAGNVLFSPDKTPAIIDLTLYWRPAGYASAIVAVDSYEWSGATEKVLHYVASLPQGRQLLIRAALFRAIRSAMNPPNDAESQLATHHRTAIQLSKLAD